MSLAIALGALAVTAGGLEAYGKHKEGQAASKMATFEAGQMEQKGIAEVALGQRKAAEKRREADLLQSRAVAVSAAGGGTSTDASMLNILGDIEAEGEYNALTEMFDAKMRDRDLKTAAKMRRAEGKQARRAGNMAATVSILKTAGSFAGAAGGSAGKVSANTGDTIPWNGGTFRGA